MTPTSRPSVKQTLKNIADPKHPEGGWILPHVALIAALGKALAVALLALGIYGGLALEAHGGFNPHAEKPVPITTRPLGGAPAPMAYSLNRYIVRIHDQGVTQSCVGQTGSTIAEIDRAEAGIRHEYSAGFIWNQVTGGIDVGISYQQMFSILNGQGDAPQALVGWEPRDYAGPYFARYGYWTAENAAASQRFSSMRGINVWDQATIEYQIGVLHNPLAFAAPWDSNWVQHWQTSTWLPWPNGPLEFWHSVTIVGYNQYGVILLQSWPHWGDSRQEALIPWNILAASSGSLVVFQPAFSRVPPPPPHPKHRKHRKHRVPFPLKAWHKHGRFVWRWRGHTAFVPWWWQHHGRFLGSPTGRERYNARRHVSMQPFEHGWTWHHGGSKHDHVTYKRKARP